MICLPGGGHLGDLGLEPDFLERLLRIRHHGPRQVGVGPGQNAVQRLDDRDLAAERGINGAQFHADVAAADDEQVLRDILDLQRLGGGHDARIAEVKRLGHGGQRTDGQNGRVVIDELLPLLGLDAQRLRAFEVSRGP